MSSRVKSFIKNTGIFLLGSFGSKFLTFLLLPLYTSILSTAQYGQIDLVTTTVGLLLPIVSLSLSEAIFRFVMNGDIDNKRVLSNGTFTICCTYILALVVLNVVNFFLKWEYMIWMLALLGCSMIYEILTNYLKARQFSKKYVTAGLLFTFMNLVGNILFLVVFKWGIIGYFTASLIAYVIPSILIILIEKVYKQVAFCYIDIGLTKRMLRYSLPLIFTSLSWWIVTSSDKYMIRYFLDASEVGIYSIASKIPLILQTLISIIQTVWQISTNQMRDEEPEVLKDNFVMFTKAFRQIGFIAGSALLIATQPLMMLLARNDFYAGWIYAPFLILSITFSFATGMVSTLYGAYEKNLGVLLSVLVGGAVNILLNLVLIPYMGVLGATISTAISRLIIAIYRLKDTEKFLQFDREYGKIAINCILILAQCCLLITLKNWVYPVQILFFILIGLYNREIVVKGIFYVRKLIRRHE